MSTKFTDKEFVYAWRNSNNIRGVLKILGLNPSGGNYTVARKTADKLGLTEKDFKNNNISIVTNKKVPLEEILQENKNYDNQFILNKLIKFGIFREQCSRCGITHWHGMKIMLELDHINGDHYDNRIENLRPLCKNCHSQTKTYGSKTR